MDLRRMGVIGTSLKEHERRVAIHPTHLARIPEQLRRQLVFETGYGEAFGVTDGELADQSGGTAPREDLFGTCDILALPKPMHDDVRRMQPHQVLFGWCHAVQDPTLTQLAIDRELTLITWESMNTWGSQGDWQSHVFRKNNEIAGLAGVLHATSLLGITGHYGPPRKAVVIHFGSVSRGAVRALRGLGFADVTVLVLQPTEGTSNPVDGVRYRRIRRDGSNRLMVVGPAAQSYPLIDELAATDIIVNGILQDPDEALMFVHAGEVNRLKPGCLIIDISCDTGMGFPFARPTSFEKPMFRAGPAYYYAVDHTPSYLWDSGSWEISAALLPFLPIVLAGSDRWESDETIRRAIEIRDGRILNEKILSFQKREPQPPHARSTQ
jgi:alanine dehydrogenase